MVCIDVGDDAIDKGITMSDGDDTGDLPDKIAYRLRYIFLNDCLKNETAFMWSVMTLYYICWLKRPAGSGSKDKTTFVS